MSYAATVTLDVDNGDNQAYQEIYTYLERFGLSRKVKGEKEHTLPETTLYGIFEGQSAASIRDSVSAGVEKAFSSARVSGKFFVTIGGTSHTWAIRYPKGS